MTHDHSLTRLADRTVELLRQAYACAPEDAVTAGHELTTDIRNLLEHYGVDLDDRGVAHVILVLYQVSAAVVHKSGGRLAPLDVLGAASQTVASRHASQEVRDER